MQVRRGQTALTGFPQLSSGELGWSIDTQELYIGNGAVSEGAPAIGNTQLITEHNISNFFLTAPKGFQYDEKSPWRYRKIQDKLDDVVNINDIVDLNTPELHTEKIQAAINQIYEDSPGKPIVFPEGEYIITGTVLIPSFTEIRGAGPQKTKLINLTTASTFQTKDGAELTWEVDGEYGQNRAPRNISITGITFVNSTTNASPIMQLDAISNSVIKECEFIGDVTTNYGAEDLASGINFRDTASYPAQLTNNVLIRDCSFRNLNSAITSDYDIANVSISENNFYKLDAGIVFGKTLTGIEPQKFGPHHITISHNEFNTINKQAVYAGSTSTSYFTDINSEHNFYRNVGCNGLGDGSWTQVYEVIHFGAPGNCSTGDTFDRLNQMNTGTGFLSDLSTSTAKSIVYGPAIITSKSLSYYTIPDLGETPMFVVPMSAYQYDNYGVASQSITIDYSIAKPSQRSIRKGTLSVIVNGTSTVVSDSYSMNKDLEYDSGTYKQGVVFRAGVNGSRNLVTVYQDNDSTTTGYISYTYTVRQ